MAKFTEWIKEKENKLLLMKLLLSLFFPLFLCIIYCLREGAWISDLSLYSSQNNDALFYYTQVAAIVEKGFPQGFFGFNESRAECLSFAAWSPFMLIPWAAWGMLFGWNEMSPIVCNVVLFAMMLALVTYWIRPSIKQMVVVGSMILLFPAFGRYLMSCLAEILLISLTVAFYGLAISYVKSLQKARLVAMFVVASCLIWMRPYMVLLLFLPGFYLIKRNKRFGFLITSILAIVNLSMYFLVQYFFTADYFEGLYNWDIFTAFIDYGFEGGFYNFVYTVKRMMQGVFEAIVLSVSKGAFLGSNYCVLFLLMFFILLLLLKRRRSGLEKYTAIYIHYLCSVTVSLVALLLLMQKINETSRHIMSFVLVGMVLLGYTVEVKIKTLWRPVVVALVCLYLYHVFPDDGKDYQVPIAKAGNDAEQEAWEIINQNIELNPEKVPSYENTMIWVFSDKLDGEVTYMPWQHMLSIPAGMGISCCTYDFLAENWDTLQSRYLSTLTDGDIAEKCEESGYIKVGEAYGKVLYKRY